MGPATAAVFPPTTSTYPGGVSLDGGLTRLDLAWYWTCGGYGTEQCVIGVWTQESVPCEPDSFDSTGWLVNFGTLSCNPGGYYYSNVDISSFGEWPATSTGTGSYVIAFLTSSGAALATCAQPMLWGTTGWHSPCAQGPNQLDDDNPLDGVHSEGECYSYSFGVCPDPLGAMAQFWGYWCCIPPCYDIDYNRDGVVDIHDVTSFLNLWVLKDRDADCDSNCVVDVRDFTCFLNGWVACR